MTTLTRREDRTARTAVAVLIPCHNEAAAIAKVVRDFHDALPEARVYVYDNNSTDATVAEARAAGAEVRSEPRQGKGHVVRRMFADIDADVYVLIDGDDTYDATEAPRLVGLLVDGALDMVNGRRVEDRSGDVYRSGHRLGNTLFNRIVQLLFGDGFEDIFSGYKVFSRRFVKSFPALSQEFEIETELSVHALTLRLPVAEVATHYRERAPGSQSKLRTYRDGARILGTILVLLKHERPLALYAAIAAAFGSASIALFVPVLIEYLQTGLVPRFPTAILSSALMLAGLVSLANGLILSAVTRGRWELRRMFYLNATRSTVGSGETDGPARA
jgi:glycosyltransferase involved in cell wall biosynthesis